MNELNKVILRGRLTRDPEVRYSQGENAIAIARYTLAVDKRSTKKDEENQANFINCTALGKNGEFAEKYFKKGTRVIVVGRIDTGSYVSQEGKKVYTWGIIVEESYFGDSKQSSDSKDNCAAPSSDEGFMNIPDGIDEELPFN